MQGTRRASMIATYERVRLEAALLGRIGVGIQACPYRKPSPWQSVWLQGYVHGSQIDIEEVER
jgi:hypothetical protein